MFWYDDKAEFAEDIDSVELKNAKVYKLTEINQFYTKRFLEREDTKTNYLIYDILVAMMITTLIKALP